MTDRTLLEKIHQTVQYDVQRPARYSVDTLNRAATHLESAHEITAHTLNTDNEQARAALESYTNAMEKLNAAGALVTGALRKLNDFLANVGLPPFDITAFQPGNPSPSPETIYEPQALSHVGLVHVHPNVGPLPIKEKMHTEERMAAWRARVNFVAAVRSMGGALAEDPQGRAQSASEDDAENTGQQHIIVRPDGGLDPTHPRLENIRELMPDLAMPWERSFFELCESEDVPTLPYMLVIPMEDAGEGKYLIEAAEQHAQAKTYITTLGKHNRYLRNVVAKEFIRTPSEHYTSFRVLATASGRIEAAGLLYSDHAKWESRTVDKGVYGLSKPDTPHYIAARDVRSNLSQGGHVIPLMGENPQPVSDYEQEILAAHNIDPASPSIPPELQAKATELARHYGRHVDSYVGLDFILSDTGEIFFLEGNVGPGSKTFTACHNAGEPMSYVEIYDGIFRRLLQDLKQTKPS